MNKRLKLLFVVMIMVPATILFARKLEDNSAQYTNSDVNYDVGKVSFGSDISSNDVKYTVDDDKTEIPKTKVYNNNEKSMSSSLVFISLGLNIFSIVLILFLLSRQYGFRSRVINTVIDSHRVLRHFQNKLPQGSILNTENLNSKEIDKMLSKNMGLMSEEFQKLMRIYITQIVREEKQKETPVTIGIKNQLSGNKLLQETLYYASSISSDSNEFEELSTEPNDNTVFELSVNQNNQSLATFDVYKGSHEKVLQYPHYIRNGGEMKFIGYDKMITESRGVAKADRQGKWHIVEKVKVKVV
ncbi:MAG: hypothetical protein PHH37_09455 [Paludibacter sp.]|nr:hypothetical protein [Paludibacter sp.]